MPNTASASVLPDTCAMPQSSRTMVTFCASRSQRAASADGARCAPPAGATTSSSARAMAFSMPRLYSAAAPQRPGLHRRLGRAGDEEALHVLRGADGAVERIDIGPDFVARLPRHSRNTVGQRANRVLLRHEIGDVGIDHFLVAARPSIDALGDALDHEATRR